MHGFKPTLLLRPLVLLLLLLATAADARLRDQLSVFFDLGPHDVPTRLEQPENGSLRVELRDTTTGVSRTLTAEVPPASAERLRREAESSGVAVGTWSDAPSVVPSAPTVVAEERPVYLSEPRELSRNRLNYVLTQTVFSYYLYSIALPVALDADPERSAALQILSIPVAFGTHYFIARGKDFHDAHLWSTDYFSTNALILSYGIPLVLGGFNESSFRAGSFLAAGAYPVGLWAGYKHGNQLLDDPGRVKLQSAVAYSSGLLGYLAGVALVPEDADDEEGSARAVVAGVLGAGIAGHYLSYKYRAGEAVPGGVGGGLQTHVWMGVLSGVTLAVVSDVDDANTALWMTTFGGAAGLAEGLYFFNDRQDSYEQSRYNSWGALGGAITPIGVAFLFGSEPNPKGLMVAVTLGSMAGYAFTRQFTSHLVEKPRDVKNSGHPGFTFDFAPRPDVYTWVDESGRTRSAMRVKIPGAAYRF